MTGNEMEVKFIMGLGVFSLLEYIRNHPEYLSDPYYEIFLDAIDARIEQLSSQVTELPVGNVKMPTTSDEAGA